MANADTPFGLKLVGSTGQGLADGTETLMYAPSTYATGIFIGDPVLITGTANTSAVTVVGGGSFEIGVLPEVNVATVGNGNGITGVVVGVYPTNRDSATYGAASTERVLRVSVDRQAEYEIQADGAIAATEIGLNAVLIATHSGSTVTGISGHELDTTSDAPDADASNQLTILRQSNRVGNEPNLIHNKVIVRLNNPSWAIGAIGL